MGTAGVSLTTNNIYGIKLSATTCINGPTKTFGSRTFCAYNTPEEGVEAWFKRISEGYVNGGINRGILLTVDQIVPVYAPSADSNNETLYINQIKSWIDSWGAANN